MSADRSRASCRDAFEGHRRGIYRHVLRIVRNPADAEDLTQETLLRAHRQVEGLEVPAALGPWLHRIATNVCRDFLRPASRRAAQDGGAGGRAGRGEEPEAAGEGPGPDQLVAQAEMSACGGELFALLPGDYRKVLRLHDIQGLTSAEIARLLHCTPGAVKIRLHRARSRFRALLVAGCDLYRDERGVLVGERKPPRA
jgi:RNA polymerase sigma-70 factor (ECF subfamily)